MQNEDFAKQYEQLYKVDNVEYKLQNKNLLNLMKKYRDVSDQIGFTLTFNSSYHDEDPDLLYTYLVRYVKQYFTNENMNFIVMTEFTAKGIIHFHGIIYNCYQRFVVKMLTSWRKWYGIIKLEYKLSDKWEVYILKEEKTSGYPAIHNL